MVRGILITCEGIDGSGKSTASRGLVDVLRAKGRDVRAHSEPTRSWLGEAVRRGFSEPISPWSEALLFMADHATHVTQVKGHLQEGRIVVSDRWSDSTFAYQGAALDAPTFDAVEWLRRTEAPFDLAPDVTLLFDLDPELAMERVGARGATEKFEKVEFLEKVRRNYLRLAKMESARWVVLDAARPAAVVLDDAVKAVLARLPL